jgi:diguanylate cyclase (GGDEF)-like protein
MAVSSRDLRIRIERQPTWKDLMAEANLQLVQINEDYEELTQRLESLLHEKEELTRRLEAANSELRRLATTDPLTNVANRRHFTDALTTALNQCREDGTPVTLLLLDVDHFKNVNDTHGHAAGDDVLRAIAERLARCIRDVDLVGRVGGEEFAILLPETVEMHGMEVAERLRRSLGDAPLTSPSGLVLAITASFGGTTTQPGIAVASPDQFLSQADTAMYHSKDGGRNRLSWHRSSGIAPVSGWH